MALYQGNKLLSGVVINKDATSAFQAAQAGGYQGTEQEFNEFLANAEAEIGGVQSHIDNQNNPHNVTADQVQVTENVVNAIKETGNWSVDGVLSQIGSMLYGGDTLYRWMKKKVDVVYNGFGTFTAGGPKDSAFAIYTATSYELADDDTLQLIDPTAVSIRKPTYTAAGVPSNGTYFAVTATGLTTVWRASADTVTRTQNIIQDATTMLSIAQLTITNAESWSVVVSDELVTSTDPNAHYDGEVDDEGYTYTALEPIVAFVPRMATGSYVGTGTAGESNPNTITVGFKPKFLLVWWQTTNLGRILIANNCGSTGATFKIYSTCQISYVNTIFADDSVSWYAPSTSGKDWQCNESGQEYYWVAIG